MAENVASLLRRLSASVEPGTIVLFGDDSDVFFHREALTATMTARGFKILLEMQFDIPDLVRCEVPFVFVKRVLGTSKGTIREGLRYLRKLVA